MDIETQLPHLNIKGVREGLLATFGAGGWENLSQALIHQVVENSSFFKGARLAIDVGNRPLGAVELGTLRDMLSDQQVSLWAVLSESEKTELTAQVLGLATRLSDPLAGKERRRAEIQNEHESALMVQKTLRSGVKISAPGHVVIVGDVNPGGEIEAGGSVLVWGRLKGTVHAGKDGDAECRISAIDFQPAQLRIAGMLARPADFRKRKEPQTALIRDGRIVVEIWNGKGI